MSLFDSQVLTTESSVNIKFYTLKIHKRKSVLKMRFFHKSKLKVLRMKNLPELLGSKFVKNGAQEQLLRSVFDTLGVFERKIYRRKRTLNETVYI